MNLITTLARLSILTASLFPFSALHAQAKAKAKPSSALPKTTVDVPMNAQEKANVAVVFAFMNALNVDKDAAKVAPFIADNLITHNPEIKGKAGMVGFADYLKNTYPNAKVIEWIHVYAKDDLVVQHYLYSHDGKKVDNKIVDFFRVKNGKITEYWDVLGAP
jgi:predicted SnoaL-like aldol condensation-catalyzing enzyme